MKSIQTEIEIEASPEKVWNLLMDFASYPQWNPFIKTLEGKAEKGRKLKVVLQLPDGKPMTFKPNCLSAESGEEFRWLGHLIVPGLFDGEHFFRMKELENGRPKFVQGENFKGLLIPLVWRNMKDKTIRGFELMNKALKARAEAS